jgi:hypothetical protein
LCRSASVGSLGQMLEEALCAIHDAGPVVVN